MPPYILDLGVLTKDGCSQIRLRLSLSTRVPALMEDCLVDLQTVTGCLALYDNDIVLGAEQVEEALNDAFKELWSANVARLTNTTIVCTAIQYTQLCTHSYTFTPGWVLPGGPGPPARTLFVRHCLAKNKGPPERTPFSGVRIRTIVALVRRATLVNIPRGTHFKNRYT